MERFCKTCGGFVKGETKFCPNCGAKMENAVELDKPDPTAPVYASPSSPASPAAPMGRSVVGLQSPAPPPERKDDVLSMGQWLGTILVCTCFGFVSLIFNIIWGFAAKGVPENKRNYCRAMLIVNIIISIASTLLIIFFVFIFLNTPEIKELIAAEAANSAV